MSTRTINGRFAPAFCDEHQHGSTTVVDVAEASALRDLLALVATRPAPEAA